jgi:hypothetical protein
MILTDEERSYLAQNKLELKRLNALDGHQIGWQVVQYSDEESRELIIAEAWEDNPRKALDDAIRFYKIRNDIEYFLYGLNGVIYVAVNLDDLKEYLGDMNDSHFFGIDWTTVVTCESKSFSQHRTLAVFTEFDNENRVITKPLFKK